MKRLLSLFASLVLFVALLANPLCPSDDSGSYFTGKTRTTEAGKQLKQYKCYLYGHLFWAS